MHRKSGALRAAFGEKKCMLILSLESVGISQQEVASLT